RVQRDGQRLAVMVSDLLDATRIEASRLSLSPQMMSLPAAISDLIGRIRPTLGDHPVRVEVKGSPPPVRVDPTRLDQIVTNLVENAAKYSAAGSPVAISLRPEGGGVVIAVEDRGLGIAPADLSRLFDRFYQTKRAREKKSGLGLGLYITK